VWWALSNAEFVYILCNVNTIVSCSNNNRTVQEYSNMSVSVYWPWPFVLVLDTFRASRYSIILTTNTTILAVIHGFSGHKSSYGYAGDTRSRN